MAISYPLTLPASPGFKRFVMRARSTAAMSASPFTLQQQLYQHQGEVWSAECTLPAMVRADAEAWTAFLLSLRGRWGTFLLGDPAGKTPRGSGAGYPSVDGGAQLGNTLATLGWTPYASGVLLKGDYLQIVKNYEPYPRAFDNAHWTKSQCTITATDIMAPSGAAEAERAAPTGGATDAYVMSGNVAPSGGYKGLAWYGSVWLKAASGTPMISLVLHYGPDAYAIGCNLTTDWQHFAVGGILPDSATSILLIIGYWNSWIEAEGPIDMWGASVYCPNLDARLHKVLQNVEADGAGRGRGSGMDLTVEIWPRLRESPPDFSAVITSNPVGLFRLAENTTEWDLDEVKNFGMGFSAIEAI